MEYKIETRNNNVFNKQLKVLYEIIGEEDFSLEFIIMLKNKNLNKETGQAIKSKCVDLIKNNQFTYENIAIYDVIDFEIYSYLLNATAFWILDSKKEFKKRDYYEYLGKTENKEEIINLILANGKNYTDNPLINKFVEYAVLDNNRLFFMPKSMIVDGHKFNRKQVISMIKHVNNYEYNYHLSPRFIFTYNKKIKKFKYDTSFEKTADLRNVIFDKINLMISLYYIQITDALKELDKINRDPDALLFKSVLKMENLDKDTNGASIKKRLEKRIYNLEIIAKDMDDEISKEIKIEVKNKQNKLKNKLFKKIGKDEINDSFLQEITRYDLIKEDAIQIREDMLNKIENNIKETDYEKEFNKIINHHQIKRRHQILTDLLLENINSKEFNDTLTNHNLTHKKQDILNKIQDNILNNRIKNEKDLPENITKYVLFFEKEDVKSELKKVNTNCFENLLRKYTISSFLPLKQSKIDKLLDKVDVKTIKYELGRCGVTKYMQDNANESKNINNGSNRVKITIK